MESLEDSIRFIVSSKVYFKGNELGFDSAVSAIRGEALTNGLEDSHLDTLAQWLVSNNKLSSTKFVRLMQCLVPRAHVPASVVRKVQLWLFSYQRTAPIRSLVFVLQWVLALLEFKLTEREVVNEYYELYFGLIQYDRLNSYVCKLIHELTEPDDISRWRVKRVLFIERKFGARSHTTALLSLFKSYKPEVVPETMPPVNIHTAFKKLPEGLRQHCQQALERVQTGTEGSDPRDNIVWFMPPASKKSKMKLIPPVNYISFGSRLYQERETYSVLEFKKFNLLNCHLLSLDIPNECISLLVNPAGCHIITFRGSEVQGIFSYQLFGTLCSALLQRNKKFEYREMEHLLDRLVALEDYMQQGIPVVSRFMVDYLALWDGLSFQPQVYKLLSWITFYSFEELHDCILVHLKVLFVSSDEIVKCQVISCLKKMIANLFLVVQRRVSDIDSPFLHCTNDWDITMTLGSLTKFVEQLVVLGLRLERRSYLVLSEALDFYETMLSLEKASGVALWTLAPAAVVYSGLFCLNPSLLLRCCKLVVRYQNVSSKVAEGFLAERQMLRTYVWDIAHILLEGNIFDVRHKGYIFKNVPDNSIADLAKVIKINNAFTLQNHLAFRPVVYSAMAQEHVGGFDKDEVIDILKEYFDQMSFLLTLDKEDLSSFG